MRSPTFMAVDPKIKLIRSSIVEGRSSWSPPVVPADQQTTVPAVSVVPAVLAVATGSPLGLRRRFRALDRHRRKRRQESRRRKRIDDFVAGAHMRSDGQCEIESQHRRGQPRKAGKPPDRKQPDGCCALDRRQYPPNVVRAADRVEALLDGRHLGRARPQRPPRETLRARCRSLARSRRP